MNKIYNTYGELVRRTITHSGWVHTQVKQADGSWWNIAVERLA